MFPLHAELLQTTIKLFRRIPEIIQILTAKMNSRYLKRFTAANVTIIRIMVQSWIQTIMRTFHWQNQQRMSKTHHSSGTLILRRMKNPSTTWSHQLFPYRPSFNRAEFTSSEFHPPIKLFLLIVMWPYRQWAIPAYIFFDSYCNGHT